MKHLWKEFLSEGELKTVGVVVCLNAARQFLIIRRSAIDERAGQWTMPGGHIDDTDDSVEAGAVRELEEEANLNCSVGDLKYVGKIGPQKYYFLTTTWSGRVDVDKPNPKTDEIEHDQYQWATIEEIKEIEDSEIPIYLLEKALELSNDTK